MQTALTVVCTGLFPEELRETRRRLADACRLNGAAMRARRVLVQAQHVQDDVEAGRATHSELRSLLQDGSYMAAAPMQPECRIGDTVRVEHWVHAGDPAAEYLCRVTNARVVKIVEGRYAVAIDDSMAYEIGFESGEIMSAHAR